MHTLTIDWDHIATLTGAALESALTAVTGIRAEPDAHGAVTGAMRDATGTREIAVPLETLHAMAGAAPVAAPHTLADAVADGIRAARAACPDITTALVLSAVLGSRDSDGRTCDDVPARGTHAPIVDVVSASGRVVATRLARALTGADDTRTVADVRDALAVALAAVGAPVADVLAADDAPADVRTVAHTYAGRVIRRGAVVVSAGGQRDRDGLAERPARAMVRTWRQSVRDGQRPGVRAIGRRSPELTDSNGYPYALGYQPVHVLAGPVPCPPAARPVPHLTSGLYRSAVATAMTRGLGSGQGIGADGQRDALRRVSLSHGHTVSPERLAGPAVGGSYVLAASNGTGARRAATRKAPERVKADAARDTLAALRARMAR